MHKQVHRHAARRLYKRDDPSSPASLGFLDENNTVERRAMTDDASDGVATVYSVVYVTAPATFTGATAGFVTLDDSTPSAKATRKATTSSLGDDVTSITSTKASTKATTTPASSASAKTASPVSTVSKPSSSLSSASSLVVATSSSSVSSLVVATSSSTLATSSSTLATSSVAASSSLSSGAALADATPKSSATASPSAAADSSTGMSGGAKAGIAIGVLVAVGLVLGLLFFLIRKKRAQQKSVEGMYMLEDEKNAMHPDVTSNPVPAPPPLSNRSQAPPRLSYRPGSQFAANVLGDAEKAAAGAAAGAVVGAASDPNQNHPVNPFGAHAQTVDASAKEGRPLSPPVELQGSPVPSPTQASFSAKSPEFPSIPSVTEAPKAEVSTAALVPLPAVAAASPGAQPQHQPNNVHRVQLEFKPSMEDELELKAGQLVRILHEYDDGWALCIRMDRSQQGVCPRTCLSKLPLKPRPASPVNGPQNGRLNGRPTGAPNPHQSGPSKGPLQAGLGHNGRPAGPPPPAQAKRNFSGGGMRGSMLPPSLSPTPGNLSTAVISPQERARSMSSSSTAPAPQSQGVASSPPQPTQDNHRRSTSASSLGNAQQENDASVDPSPLGVVARKPVPGQAL